MNGSHPPALARWLVARVVSAAKRADVLAALQDEFADRCTRHGPSAARRWYCRQALAFLSRTGGERLRGREPEGTRGRGASRLSTGLGHDIRYAARTLRRSPVVSLAAITSLALGIGANTAFFSLVDRLVLHPLPLVEADRVLAVFHAGPAAPYSSFTFADYVDYRDGTSEVLDHLAAFFETEFTVSGSVRSEVVDGALVSWNYFHALGISPAAGRFFAPDEGRNPGTNPVVVVSHDFWRTRLGGEAVIGSSISVNGASLTVIGVAPPGFHGSLVTSRHDVWVPLMMYNEVATGFFATFKAIDYQVQRMGPGRMRFLRLIGRMGDGVSVERAQAALGIVASRLATDYPDTHADRAARAVPLRVAALPMSDRSAALIFLSLLIGAVGVVLMIACANVANLLLVRAEQRSREVGIRIALGAGRRRLVRQWLAESLLMSGLGGAIGLAVATVILRGLAPFTLPGDVPMAASVHLSWPTFAFTTGISIVTGVVFGLAPALHAARSDVRTALSSGARAGDRSARLRGLLVAAQVALSVVLVVGAGLFVRSMMRVLDSDLGFASEGLVTLNVDLGATGYDASRALAFYDRFAADARAVPGVTSTTITDAPFGTSGLSVNTVWTPDSAAALDVDDVLLVNVAPSYFRTFDIPILEGHPLDPAAASDSWVLVVNRAFRDRVWGESSAVGRRIQFSEPDEGNGDDLAQVVGVAGDTRQYGLDDSPLITYRSVREYPQALVRWPMTLVAKTAADPVQTLGGLRELIRRLDPDLPVTDLTTVDERVGRVAMPQRMGLVLLSGLGLVALLVAAIGVYAAVSYSLAQRRREIGIRVALGATPSRVTGLVLRLGIGPALIGIAAGLTVTLFASRLLRTFLFGVSPLDPVTFVTAAALLLLVATGASVVPARRGAHADPVQALREE